VTNSLALEFVSGYQDSRTNNKETAISVNRLDSMMYCARGCDVWRT